MHYLPGLDLVKNSPVKLPKQSPEFHLGVTEPLDLSEAYVAKRWRMHFERYCLHYDLAARNRSNLTRDKLRASTNVSDGVRRNIWRQYFTVVQNRDLGGTVKITQLVNN
jgi:hypothetical protein